VNRRLSTLALLLACLVGMNLSLWGQSAAVTHGIRGILDPKTGAFHPLPVPDAQDEVPPALTTFSGKFVANFTITVTSTIASTTKLACTFSASLLDTATGNVITESAGSAVARGSGTTVTCTVTLPYSWSLGSGSTDKVSLSWAIEAPVEFTVSTEFPTRISSQSLGTISVPANGTTTTETIAATI
jgi:hypothetical protein